MNSPLVSIVTPSYNEEKYIEATLQSVKAQTYSPIEHIVVDGGSTDGTTDLLDEYENEYELSWNSQSDDGLYDAISTGFQRANGDILAWINANDLYFPWSIDVAVEYLSEPETEWITGRSATIDERGRLVSTPKIQRYYKRSWIKRGWYHGRGLGWFCQPSMVWTSDLWEASEGFPKGLSMAGEHHLWSRFAAHADLKSIDTIIGAHRKHEGQLSEDMASWYGEVGVSLLPKVLGHLKVNELYSAYCILSNHLK